MIEPQFQCDASILTNNDDGRRSGPPRLLAVHTSEGTGTADNLAAWQQSPESGGSYHVIIDESGRAVRGNDDAYIPWAAGWTGNRAALHVCVIGRADWSADQWLARDRQIGRLAEWIRYNAGAYGIPLVKLGNVAGSVRGVCGHDDISRTWGESDHYDPGAAFPWTQVLDRARGATAPAPAGPAVHVVMPGENLTGIAQQYGTTVAALAHINALANPDMLNVAQVLRIRV